MRVYIFILLTVVMGCNKPKSSNPAPNLDITPIPSAKQNLTGNITSGKLYYDTQTPCATCHGAWLNGEYLPGLGNSTFDPTKDEYSRFIATGTVGVNIANMVANGYGAITDSISLRRIFPLVNYTPIQKKCIADVPPLWNIKYKNALYYNTTGRGDQSMLIMTGMIHSINDTTTARMHKNNFKNVYAYLLSLKPPKFPMAINKSLAETGQKVYENSCASCHGTYKSGKLEFPNNLVNVNTVLTDPLLAMNKIDNRNFYKWYNSSWFAKNSTAKLVDVDGYMAPPLDGVWATAPYLHNGSVPTLEDLLNSKQRPKYWKRIVTNNQIDQYSLDFTKVGWIYTTPSTKSDKYTYDTTLESYSNEGHYFGDGLTVADRKALIEYLKTL